MICRGCSAMSSTSLSVYSRYLTQGTPNAVRVSSAEAERLPSPGLLRRSHYRETAPKRPLGKRVLFSSAQAAQQNPLYFCSLARSSRMLERAAGRNGLASDATRGAAWLGTVPVKYFRKSRTWSTMYGLGVGMNRSKGKSSAQRLRINLHSKLAMNDIVHHNISTTRFQATIA
jgi:hypothetical protein